MGIRRTFTRDDMRAFLTILKEELKVEYSTRSLSNVAKCKTAIKDIVDIYADRKLKEYFEKKGKINQAADPVPKDIILINKLMAEKELLYSENIFFRTQIEELKKKNKIKKHKSIWERLKSYF